MLRLVLSCASVVPATPGEQQIAASVHDTRDPHRVLAWLVQDAKPIDEDLTYVGILELRNDAAALRERRQ
jgi:hypothetical protein